MAIKKAVLVGCNYPGTDSELHGCVNDVYNMYKLLVDRFGFSEDDIKVLVDTDDNYPQPTGANIRQALHDLISQSTAGDILYFHFSGHGTRLPADDDENDETGYDECIFPSDGNLINDDEFRSLVEKLPPNVKLTIVSDSCHSGGLIENAKEQIGESFQSSGKGYGNYEDESAYTENTNEEDGSYGRDDVEIKNRSLPLHILLDMLKQKSGKDDVRVGNIRRTLFDIYGEDSSSIVKRFVRSLMGGDSNEQGGEEEPSDSDYSYTRQEDSEPIRGSNMGILVSGCQTSQTSIDTSDGDGGHYYGALSNAIQIIIGSAPPDEPITNRQLVTQVREFLASRGFTQQPGLYCSDEDADAPFIC